MRSKPLRSTAIHEAGHAAALISYAPDRQKPFAYATAVVVGAQMGGHVKLGECQPIPDLMAVVYMAGPLAEARYRRCSQTVAFLGGGMSDLDDAYALVGKDAVWSEAVPMAKRCNKMLWPAIEAIATRLQHQLILTGPDAVAIYEKALHLFVGAELAIFTQPVSVVTADSSPCP